MKLHESKDKPVTNALQNITDFHRVSSRYDWAVEATAMIPAVPHMVTLPPPDWPDATLTDCLARRLSCRNFAPDSPMSLTTLSMLLASGYGVRGQVEAVGQQLEEHPAPSASALYQLQLLVFARNIADLTPGIYRYDPNALTLSTLAGLPDHARLSQMFLSQNYVADADATILLTGKPDIPVERYVERAYRFLLIECGHVVQNIALMAAASGLGCCPIGGFEDYRLCIAAGLDPATEWPLYAAALGVPDPDKVSDLRTPADM